MQKIGFDLIYHNVTFRIYAECETEANMILDFVGYTNEHGTSMNHISKWLIGHGIKYQLRFAWRWEYPITANLWNLFSYIRFRIENWAK